MSWRSNDPSLDSALASLDVNSLLAQRKLAPASSPSLPRAAPPFPAVYPSPPPNFPSARVPCQPPSASSGSAAWARPPHTAVAAPPPTVSHSPSSDVPWTSARHLVGDAHPRPPPPVTAAPSYPSPWQPPTMTAAPPSTLPVPFVPCPPPPLQPPPPWRPSASSSSPAPPRRSVPLPAGASPPPWLNAAASVPLFPPPPPRPPPAYSFTRRSEVEAERKTERAAAARARRQRSSASRQQQRRQEESPFLDMQLTAFVQRELEVAQGDRRQVDGGRFVHLHCIADRTFDVGHSAYCDLFVQAVRLGQEGALVDPQQRQYVGVGANASEESRRRKKRKKVQRNGDDDGVDDFLRGRRSRRQPSPPPAAEVEMDQDEDAPLQRAAGRGVKRRTLLDEADEDDKNAPCPPPDSPPSRALASGDPDESEVGGGASRADGHPAISDTFQLPVDDGTSRVRGHARAQRRSWDQKETILVDVDEEVRGSLPPPSPVLEPAAESLAPRPPSPFLDLPLEEAPLYADDGNPEDDEEGFIDPLMRQLSRFVLFSHHGSSGDVLVVPPEVLYAVQPSLAPLISLTPPQPTGAHAAVTPPSALRSPVPPPVSPVSSSPTSQPVLSPTQNRSDPVGSSLRSVPLTAASPEVAPPAGPAAVTASGVGSVSSAAERKALAEMKRQRWLQEQREKQRVLAALQPASPTSAVPLVAAHRPVPSASPKPALRWLG